MDAIQVVEEGGPGKYLMEIIL
jgi:hypothetical protein